MTTSSQDSIETRELHTNGAAAPPNAGPERQPAPRPSVFARWRPFVLAAAGALLLGGGSLLGYRWWFDMAHLVSTDNAQIAGRLVQVGPLVAGRVTGINYEVGQRVAKGDIVAAVSVAVPTGAVASGTSRMEFLETADSAVAVRAPIDGIVVARSAEVGDSVPAGQPLLSLMNPDDLWVNANVEETQARKVQPGQPVTVHVDSLDINLPGRVLAVTPASAATFSVLPVQNFSGNFTKVTQLVSVKIGLDPPLPALSIGTSAEVKIRVLD